MFLSVHSEKIRQLFDLKLTRRELGALYEIFDLPQTEEINCGDFLRPFLKLGLEMREKDHLVQLKQQSAFEQHLRDEEEEKLKALEDKMNFRIDYDFSDVDAARAHERMKEASTKFDKSLPGSRSLDCFEVEHLSAGMFREALRRTFDLHFTDKEMGALVRKYDTHNEGVVHCGPFLTMFLRLGQQERHRLHREQLAHQRKLIEEAEAENARKLKAASEKKSFKIYFDFDERHLQSALTKLQDASTKFDKSRGVTLDSFVSESLSPQEFQEAIQRTFNLTLGPSELGAIVTTFDKNSSGKV